jgi:hypothetical protein
MDSSAFDLLFLPILWGTLGGIGVGTVLFYAMQAVEAMLIKCSRAPQSIEPTTRTVMPESSDPIGRMQSAA